MFAVYRTYEAQLSEFEKAVENLKGGGDYVRDFVPGDSTARLRAHLIKEEADELCEALLDPDSSPEEVLKEICDLIYVAVGTGVKYEWPVKEAFNRVHQNNLLKVNNSKFDQNTGKLLKPKDHPPVSLKDLVAEDRHGSWHKL